MKFCSTKCILLSQYMIIKYILWNKNYYDLYVCSNYNFITFTYLIRVNQQRVKNFSFKCCENNNILSYCVFLHSCLSLISNLFYYVWNVDRKKSNKNQISNKIVFQRMSYTIYKLICDWIIWKVQFIFKFKYGKINNCTAIT